MTSSRQSCVKLIPVSPVLRLITGAMAILMTFGAGTAGLAGNVGGAPREPGIYIVQLAAPPALTYGGRPDGPAATRPVPGERFEPDSTRVRRYARQLTDSHDTLLRSVGAYAAKVYSYRYAFNGFAARLTPDQAQKLQLRKNVLRVWEDQVRYLYTNDSPVFLGLFDTDGGLVSNLGLKGENIVVGIIDSGIAPEHPSFANRRSADMPSLCRSTWAESSLLGLWLCQRFKRRPDIVDYQPVDGWGGRCESGEEFGADACNDKIVGARYYIDGFLESHLLDQNEFVSPRDADGHGTHIASTAAGNEVPASLSGKAVARINGVAPRARIAVYKACWLEPGQTRGTCSTSDLQRAIEDAVADGVDIINYSVGNTDISLDDPDDLALLAAANAGVLSVVAAGNDGVNPFGFGSVLSPAGAPWVLTVGASTRTGTRFQEVLRVDSPPGVAGDYAMVEARFTPPLKEVGPLTGEIVIADDGIAPAGEASFDACSPLVNDTEMNGAIALLQRGTCDFQDKIRNVEAAGAIAAVIFNNQANPIIMTGTRGSVGIPAVLIGQADGQLIFDRVRAGESVELTLDQSLFRNQAETGNVIADFSSRGPNETALDILKPDITAPGVNILAAQTPDVANGIRGEHYQYLSGTSMAVPHVVGIAALIREAHPDWTPARIKSALMTTARQDVVKEDGETAADPFDFGSGHVVPNRAVDPGLVYDAGKNDFDVFACGREEPRVGDSECQRLVDAGVSTEGFNLNQPAVAVGALVSSRTIKRKVTNVGDAAQYRASIEAPPGVDVEVVPPVLSLDAGETGMYEIRLTKRDADLTEWRFGALSWEDGEHAVRSPIVARPVPFLAPVRVSGAGTSGELSFDVEFGYDGPYEVLMQGLSAPSSDSGTVADDPLNAYEFDPFQVPPYIARFPLEVGNTDTYVRVALFNENTDGNDDLDLFLHYCPVYSPELGLIVCNPDPSLFPLASGAEDSNEQIEMLHPFAGTYLIDVHGFETDGPDAEFTVFAWNVGPGDALGAPVVTAPTQAVFGQTATVGVSWDGIAQQKHVGMMIHRDAGGTLQETIIEIEN